MAIQIIREISADVVKRGSTRSVYAKQNDTNSRFLNVRIQEDGKDIKVDSTSEVLLNVERPDKQENIFYGTVNEDGSVKVPLTSWMLELEGTLICDVSIVSEDPEVAKLTTMLFNIYVEAAVVTNGSIIDTEDYNVIVDLLKRTDAAATKAEEAAKAASEAAESADELKEKCEQAEKDAQQAMQDLAAGGYINSLREQNKGKLFSFWVGSTEEFKKITDRVENCLYIFTDAPDVIESAEYPGCYYRTVDGETEWINPPMIEGVEYRTSERCKGKPVYTKSISTQMMDVGGHKAVRIFSNVDSQSIEIIELSAIAKAIQEGSTDYFHWQQLAGVYAVCADLQETNFDVEVVTPNDKVFNGATAYITVKYTKR